MTIVLSGPTWLLVVLPVLLVVVLCGPEWMYRRMLELIRVLRGGRSGQCDTTPPRGDIDRPPS